MPKYRPLDITELESSKAQAVRRVLNRRVIGQTDGVDALVDIVEKYNANLYDKTRPIGSALFLGPSGCGKTRTVQAFCEAVGRDENSCIKVDCGEFQHSHEIAKLIGSPPGYLGHTETPARLTQENLDALHTPDFKLSVVFFDEIEKAADNLWHLLLGVLDKGKLTLGNNRVTDFSKTIVLMTSNAGSVDMDKAINGGSLGFSIIEAGNVDDEAVANIGITAAKKKFTPEFINRLDRMIAFQTLTKEQIGQIAELELQRVQTDILEKTNPICFFVCSPAAKRALIAEGYDPKYNGRHIRRTIERRVQLPMARIIAARAIKPTEKVVIDYKGEYPTGEYTFGATND